jgi:BASS family bile acid:Na+ symporter
MGVGGFTSIETIYATLLVVALVTNGIAAAIGTPVTTLLAPARELGLIGRIAGIDLLLVPLVVVGTALLLGVDPVTRAGLVIVAAASCGPIGVALARIGRGDVPLGVTLVIGFGALNLLTVPVVTGLLLPDAITLPLGPLLTSLLGLAVAPLALGRLVGRLVLRGDRTMADIARPLAVVARVGDVALAGAVLTALLLDTREVVGMLAGVIPVIALIAMGTVALAARFATRDVARRRTIALTINARAVGLALTLATLHLGDVPGLRATILTYGGLTQLVPLLVVLFLRRRRGATEAVSRS